MNDRLKEIVWLVCVRRALKKEFGREPRPEELAQHLGMPLEQLKESFDTVAHMKRFGFDFDRMDNAALTDLLEGHDPVKPIPESLTPCQEKRIREALGIGPDADLTPEELERRLSVTHAGIRELERKILRRLGMPEPDDPDDE